MKYSDLIKMNSCGVYSIAFPTDNIVETLENAELEERNGVKCEIVKNPFFDKKVCEVGNNGLFFSVRVEFKHLTKQILAQHSYELKIKGISDEESIQQATVQLYEVIPPSSEIYNIFYNRDSEILMINSNSKRAKIALMQLIAVFGLAGVKSIVVSDEKLGINQRFVDFIEQKIPMFKLIEFNHQATLRKETYNEKSYRTCRHLDTEKGKANALQVLNEGFEVQSLEMAYQDILRFKLDENLNLRNLRFKSFDKTVRRLNSDDAFSYKVACFQQYIDEIYHCLSKIIQETVLEFTQETKLEQFV